MIPLPLMLVVAAVFLAALAFEFRDTLFRRCPRADRADVSRSGQGETEDPVDAAVVPLEVQIESLRAAGLRLSSYVTIDDLLHSWPREQYERQPYDLLLFMFGAEIEDDSGRRVCDAAWDFDFEAIEGDGSYVRIVRELVALTGNPALLGQVDDKIDIDAGTAHLSYRIGAQSRTLAPEVDNDWADPEAFTQILRDIESSLTDGRRFWGADNGQAVTVFLLTDATADGINALRRDVLRRL